VLARVALRLLALVVAVWVLAAAANLYHSLAFVLLIVAAAVCATRARSLVTFAETFVSLATLFHLARFAWEVILLVFEKLHDLAGGPLPVGPGALVLAGCILAVLVGLLMPRLPGNASATLLVFLRFAIPVSILSWLSVRYGPGLSAGGAALVAIVFWASSVMAQSRPSGSGHWRAFTGALAERVDMSGRLLACGAIGAAALGIVLFAVANTMHRV
jgi:hypothetical protein